MTLKDLVRNLINDQIGMMEIHVKMFSKLRDKADNNEYKRGVQDCIDWLEESILTGMSYTDDEIYKKERGLSMVLENIMANRSDN